MIVASRKEVLAGLAVLGARSCHYSSNTKWAERCDCKYGVRSPESKWYDGQTGCPELRAAHAIISTMTYEEWKALTTRSGSVGPSDFPNEGVSEPPVGATPNLSQPYDTSRPCSNCGWHDSDGGCNCG